MLDFSFHAPTGALPVSTFTMPAPETTAAAIGQDASGNPPNPPSKVAANVFSEAGQADDVRLPPGQR